MFGVWCLVLINTKSQTPNEQIANKHLYQLRFWKYIVKAPVFLVFIFNFIVMKKLFVLLTFIAISLVGFSQQIPKWKITDVENLMNAKDGKILVLNFWATFCKPCVAEIPFFIQVTDKYKSEQVQLYLISVDLPSAYPKKISSFAKQKNFNSNIAWLQETDADYFCPRIDSSWSGSIPAMLILNTKTGYRKFFEGEIKAELFEKELKKALGN